MNAKKALIDALTDIKIAQGTGHPIDASALVASTVGVARFEARKSGGRIAAEDLHQDILEWVVTQLNQRDVTVDYIANTVTTVASRLMNRRALKEASLPTVPYEDVQRDEAAGPELFEVIERSHSESAVRRAYDLLAKKNPNHYRAVQWFYEGCDDEEISRRFRAMGIDPSSIREWRKRGKAFLEKQLGEYNE